MVNIYYQFTEQVSDDRWRRVTRHVTIDVPEIEALLGKGNDVIDACVALPAPGKQGAVANVPPTPAA